MHQLPWRAVAGQASEPHDISVQDAATEIDRILVTASSCSTQIHQPAAKPESKCSGLHRDMLTPKTATAKCRAINITTSIGKCIFAFMGDVFIGNTYLHVPLEVLHPQV